MSRFPDRRVLFLALALATSLAAGCTLPRVPGFSSYYAITNPATGQVYYSDELRREARGVVEFRDGATGAWISLASAQVREIDKAEFRANARP